MSRTAETTGPRDRAAASPAARTAGRLRALVLAVVAGLAALLVGALPAQAEDLPAQGDDGSASATVLPGGSVVVPAASGAADGRRWQLVGTPDASLVRATAVDAATGELSVEVAPGYRGRVVLVRRAVDRAAGTASEPERVVLDVAGDAPLAAGERLRVPLGVEGAGSAPVEVPLPPLEEGAGYAVEAGPSLAAEVDPVTGRLRVTASAAGPSSVVVVPTAADGTAGEPVTVPVDVAPSLPGLSGATAADAPVVLPVPAGDLDDVAVQQPATGASAALTPGGLEVDPRGTSGALALALLPSAGGVVGDPVPVVVAVAPVVAPVELVGAPGDVLRAPLGVLGTGVRVDVRDDAGGALAVDGDELVVTVPADAAGELRGALVGVDADGLASGTADVVVAVTGTAPEPPAPSDDRPSPSDEAPPSDDAPPSDGDVAAAPAPDDVAPAPSGDVARAQVLTPRLRAAAAAPAPAPGEDLVARAAAAKLADEELRASREASPAPAPAPAMELAASTAPVPAGTPLAPGLVLVDSFSTAAAPTAAPVTALTTAPVPAALPRTGGELAACGAIGGLALALGLGLLVLGRRRLLVARG